MEHYLVKLLGLKGKTAVVIGAAGYLCSEMAAGFAKSGVSVALLDKNKKSLKKIENKIKKYNSMVFSFAADVTDKKSLEKARRSIIKKTGRIDILINGAGINAPTPFFKITLSEWNKIIETQLTGTFLSCQVFGLHMVKKRKGSIINISSVSSGPPLSKAFTYSVAKSGVKNLTQNLAREWAPFNVRVNALKPGFFPTDWSLRRFIDSKRKKAILSHTPMKRYGKPSELVGAVLWLSSESASFVTGSEIAVDGGFTAMTI